MTQVDPGQSQQPAVSDSSMALFVYVLYFVAYFIGITAILGVIIAHVQNGSGDAMLDSHYQFQIWTFWVGLLYLRRRLRSGLCPDRVPGLCVVVHLVADQEHQGHARVERELAGPQSAILAVRVTRRRRPAARGVTDILFERRGTAGIVTLNRPEALNALTHAMVRALTAQLAAGRTIRR